MTRAHEINFDGLVGPTHNYAGLAVGNIASAKNKGKPSNPKMAALQGLAKMKLLAKLGVKQAILPPHQRPDINALRQLGFSGTDSRILETAARQSPAILAACYSASAMWTANAATVTPSTDAADGRLHFVPANLISQFHRSLETATTSAILRRIFPDPSIFAHQEPLPATWPLGDEGAANHMRFASGLGTPGVHVFTYGRDGLSANDTRPSKYPARQTYQASQAVARCLHLRHTPIFARQSRLAIDAGAFHNDVVATSHLNLLLCHQRAWENTPSVIAQIRKQLSDRGAEVIVINIIEKQISLVDAVKSYLFNSQIVTLADNSMCLIAPTECRRIPSVRRFLDNLPAAGTPISAVQFVPLRQSMRNGGGPACLRLRVTLTDRELAATHSGVFFTSALEKRLTKWINRHYRDKLHPRDLADPQLLHESRHALDELTSILGLGSIYEFQKA